TAPAGARFTRSSRRRTRRRARRRPIGSRVRPNKNPAYPRSVLQPLMPGRYGSAAGVADCSFDSAATELPPPRRQAPPLTVSTPALSACPCSRGASSIVKWSMPLSPPSSRALRSPLSIFGENVVAVLHYRVAREPALRIVLLRRIIGLVGRPERIGRGIILERRPAPSAAV